MSSGLQPVTTNSFPNESFSFKPLRIVHTLFLCLDSLFALSTGQGSMYISWPSLQYGFYSQNTLLEGFMYSRHLSGKKTLPLRPRQGLSPAALTGSSGLRACPQFARTVHCAFLPASRIPETSPFLSQSSGRVHSSLKSQWCMNPSTVWNPSGIKRNLSLFYHDPLRSKQ